MLAKLVIILCLLFSWPVSAGDREEALYTVISEAVSKRGEDAVVLRAEAVTHAQFNAYNQVLANVLRDAQYVIFPEIGDDEIAGLVHAYEVDNEVISEGSYEADITVTINKTRMLEFLAEKNIAIKGNVLNSVLVLPVFSNEQGSILWERNNYWMLALKSALIDDQTLPFVLPVGDKEDQALVPMEELVKADKRVLLDIAERYDVENVIVAHAQFDDSMITVTLQAMDGRIFADKKTNYNRLRGESFTGFLYSAAYDVSQWIQNSLQQRRKQAGPVYSSVDVIFKVKSLSSWMKFKAVAEQVNLLKNKKIQSLSSDLVRLELFYAGTINEYSRFLLQNGIELKKKGDAFYLTLLDSDGGS